MTESFSGIVTDRYGIVTMEIMRNRFITSALYIIAAITILTGVLTVCIPPKEYSERENRYLQTAPRMEPGAIRDRSFMDETENYVSDHVPFRDTLLSLSAVWGQLMGRKELAGVYLCGDDTLIQAYEEPQNTDKIINQIKKLSENLDSAMLTVMMVPTAVTVYRDMLPAYAPDRDGGVSQMDTISRIYDEVGGADNVKTVDVSSYLISAAEEGDRDIYYRTDHHWTTHGAFIGYRAYCGQTGAAGTLTRQPQLTTVSEDFYGTLFSKVGKPGIRPDSIEIYSPSGTASQDGKGTDSTTGTITVRYEDTGEETDTLYNYEWLDKRDKYSMFLNNLHSLVIIENPSSATDRELAVVKDSYANSMIPYLTADYRRIYVYDTRYFKGGVSSDINSRPAVSEVLLLYNLNTIDSDRGIGGIY